MSEAIRAQKTPYVAEAEAGGRSFRRACGCGTWHPFCNGTRNTR